jgi:broad specificity phosphatase PhoE
MNGKLRVGVGIFFAVMAAGHFGGGEGWAQSAKKTIVLVRHSEKDTSPGADKRDPDLSAEGRQRALRFKEIARRYKPHEIFSTDFKRTRQTVEPIAAQRKKQIQLYNVAEQAELVRKIMASDTEHYLIVGHSNTIPHLANLFADKLIFRELLESEYGLFWVLRFRKGVLRKIEVIPY